MRNKCHWHQWTRPQMLLMHRTTHCKGELSSPKCQKCWVKNSCSRSINFFQKETLPTFVYWFSSRRKHLTYVGYIHLRREEIILYTKYKLISLFSQCFTLAHHIPNTWDPLWSKGANNYPHAFSQVCVFTVAFFPDFISSSPDICFPSSRSL